MSYGMFGLEHVSFLVRDAAAVSKSIVRTKGARGLGTIMGLQRERVDILEDGRHQGALAGDEQAQDVTITVDWDSTSQDVTDFCLARGATYGAGGTAPMVTVDPVGQVPAVELVIRVVPPTGTPWTRTYSRAYLSADQQADNPATHALTFSCYGGTDA